MDNIIHFPNAVQATRGAMTLEPAKATVKDNAYPMLLGPWEYTCHKCNTKVTFETQNMIFRSVEFHCGKCGAIHKVVNPAFTTTVTKK